MFYATISITYNYRDIFIVVVVISNSRETDFCLITRAGKAGYYVGQIDTNIATDYGARFIGRRVIPITDTTRLTAIDYRLIAKELRHVCSAQTERN